jgi:hypothetical protein
MGRLNGAPEACQVTETLRVTCYGNFERGTARRFFKPLTIGASSVAALTIGPLPNGYAHCRRPRPAMRRAGEEGALARGHGLAWAWRLVAPQITWSPPKRVCHPLRAATTSVSSHNDFCAEQRSPWA